MTDGPTFRKDLFVGTAEYYDRFRPGYPVALLDDVRARVPLRATSRVLDLACGTGQIAFPLALHVAEVWAIDQEPELVEFARQKAVDLGVANIRWTVAAAEAVQLDDAFDLIAIGNAFHRLDREAVARRLIPHLVLDGCVALLWSDTPWHGDGSWQRAFADTLERWQDAVGARDRIPEGWDTAVERDPHEAVLQRAGLTYEGAFDFSIVERWSAESLIGLTYSTSFLNRVALGEQTEAFERDLRRRLFDAQPDGRFDQELSFEYQLARRAH